MPSPYPLVCPRAKHIKEFFNRGLIKFSVVDAACHSLRVGGHVAHTDGVLAWVMGPLVVAGRGLVGSAYILREWGEGSSEKTIRH